MGRIIGIVEAVREWPLKDKTKAHHIEQIGGTKRFFEALKYHFTRRKEAGKPLTVSDVCSYFSEVDRGAFSTEIDAFRARFKGATMAEVEIGEVERTGETVCNIVIVRKNGNIKGRGAKC